MAESGQLWRVAEHEPVTERPWDAASARAAIDEIVADAETAGCDGVWPGHPLDDLTEDEFICSLYLGGAGVIWALWQLESSLDGGSAVASALDRYRAVPDYGSLVHPPSLWMGESGMLVVADRVGSPAADASRLRTLISENREHRTWRAGPLRKGPGLCHGTAGNGFALLKLHQLTGDPVWLARARQFAMHAMEQVRRARAQFGRGRYTLFTGDVGVALYVRACLEEVADFPTVDTFG